jgi:hypothetical protein
MKAHYPAEYMTAILTAESGDIEKIAEAVAECRRLGIEVLPPSVNSSNEGFTYVDDKHIRFGLLAIKNVGADIVKAIISERAERGTYESLEDFLTRVPSKNLNKKSVEAFIMTGALQEFGDRKVLLDNLEKLLNFRREIVEGKNNNQGNLFAAIAAGFAKPVIKLEVKAMAVRMEKLQWEKELLGLYLSDHPFAEFKHLVPKPTNKLTELDLLGEGAEATICGIIGFVQKILSRQGEPMYFIGCDDGTGQVEVVVFPSLARQVSALLVDGAPLMVKGKISTRDGEVKVLADKIKDLRLHPVPEQVPTQSRTLDGIGARYGAGLVPEQVPTQSRALDGIGTRYGAGPVSEQVPTQSRTLDGIGTRYGAGPAPSRNTAGESGALIRDMTNATVEIQVTNPGDKDNLEELKKALIAHPGASQVLLVIKDSGQTRRVQTDFRVNFDDNLKRSLEMILGPGQAKSSTR